MSAAERGKKERIMGANKLFKAFASGPGHYPECNSLGAWGGCCTCAGSQEYNAQGIEVLRRLLKLEILERKGTVTR